jgi:UDP-glucose 4-epimerase
MRTKNITITGGSGFIGTHLVRLLLEKGYHVTVLDLKDSELNHPHLIFIRGDVRIRNDLESAITDRTDAVFHFAAIVSVPECEQNPKASFETNLVGTQNVLDRILHLKPEKNILIFFASSAAVYGDICGDGHRLTEEEKLPQPLSFYGLHKYASEQSLRLYCAKYGLYGLSFRFFNVYGPGQKADSPYSGVMTLFQRAFETGDEVKLYNYGNNSRDLIHVSEIARSCAIALESPRELLRGQPVNLCTGESKLIKDVFKEMSIKFGKAIPVIELPPREGDIQWSCGDNTRFKTLFENPKKTS